MIITLIVVSLAAFLAFQIIPGDSALSVLGTEGTPDQIEQLREEMGLNKPIITRYWEWLIGILQGDLGISLVYHIPVSKILAERLPTTTLLSLSAFFFVIIISIPTGIRLARYAGRRRDRIMVVVNQILMAIPPFFIGIIFSSVFGLAFRFFTPGKFVSLSENPLKFFAYLLFPALAIAIPNSAMTVKLFRSSILDELDKDYVRTAYSRGSNRIRVMRTQVLRNAIIPVIPYLAMTFATILAGSIIIEQVFVIPGIGRLLVSSISNRDFVVVQAIILLIAATVIIMNFISDIICQMIDPRLRE